MPRSTVRPLPTLSENDLARFWSYVDKRKGHGPHKSCWLWTGGKTTKGYGMLHVSTQLLYAHRLSYFIATGVDPGAEEIRHACDIPACVHPNCLLKGSHLQNMNDAVLRKRMARGDHNGSRTHPERRAIGKANGSSKVNEAQVFEIRTKSVEGHSDRVLALEYKVSQTAIAKIVRGETWKHVATVPRDWNRRQGVHSPKAKITDEIVREIRKKRAEGMTLAALCAEFKLTIGAIFPITHYKTWKHVK